MATKPLNLHSTGVSVSCNDSSASWTATTMNTAKVKAISYSEYFYITIDISSALAGISYSKLNSVKLSFKANSDRDMWAQGKVYAYYKKDAAGNGGKAIDGETIAHKSSTSSSHSATISANECLLDGKITLSIRCYNPITANYNYYFLKEVSLVLDYEEHTHSYTSEVTKQPTCTSSGVRTYTCDCGDSYTETISATGHTEETIPAVAPTCEATGSTAGKKCSVCGTVIVAQQTVAKLGHNYVSAVTKEPTCTEKGVRTYTCQNDTSHKYTEEIPAKGHTPGAEATCTTPQTCTVCGVTLANALGHSWSTTYIWSADGKTCTAKRVCSRCGTTETATATITSAVKTPATSGEMGTTTYTATFSGVGWATTQTKDVKNLYLVRWYNEDGSILLETDDRVYYGDIPEYNGITPTKAKDERYTYTHIGWAVSPTAENTTGLTVVVANIDYYARFGKTENTYVVIWKNDDGHVLETDDTPPVSYGDKPDYNGETPGKASTAQYDYKFLGWSAEVFEGVLEEEDLPTVSGVDGTIVYTAVYLPIVRQYDLDIFKSNCMVDGAVSGTYNYGTEFTIEVNPDFGYEFDHILDTELDIQYTDDTLTFVLTEYTCLYCKCKRAPAPIFNGTEQQVQNIYIVPELSTIVYVVDGELPTLETTMDTVDDLHFDVINTGIDRSKYVDYWYYPIEQLYVNDKHGSRTRVW